MQKSHISTLSPSHVYWQIPAQEEKTPIQETAKRSDDEQFQDWQITTIKSGKFIFNPIDKPKPAIASTNVSHQNKKLSQPIKISIPREESLGLSVKLKGKESSIERSVNSRLTRLVFAHFCKENHIISIKNTLFEDKQKLTEEMNLNKWMVFCKEYSILQKLSANNNTNLIFSQVYTPKAKDSKQAETTLTTIFKKCSENQTKMKFQQFISALKIVLQKLKEKTPQIGLTEAEFVKQVLYCSSEKECKAKLSSLKFTFRIPEIEYATQHPKSISKSKYNLSSSKENHKSIVRNRSTHVTLKPKMKLNPIIKEVKDKIANKPSLQLSRKYMSKIKLTQSPKEKLRILQQNELQRLVDVSKDEILDAYFKIQSSK